MAVKHTNHSVGERSISSVSTGELREILGMIKEISYASQFQRNWREIKTSSKFSINAEQVSRGEFSRHWLVEVVRRSGMGDPVAKVLVADGNGVTHVDVKAALESSLKYRQTFVAS